MRLLFVPVVGLLTFGLARGQVETPEGGPARLQGDRRVAYGEGH